jgi:hypothetical protein
MTRARHARVCLVVLATALGACAHHAAPQPGARASAPASGAPSSGAPLAIGGTAAATTGAPTSAPSSENPGDAVAARRAFDRWLAAYVASDAVRMLTYSTGAATALGSLQLATDSLVVASGGSVRATVQKESLVPGSVSPDAITFGGEVKIRREVRAARTATINDTIAGPIEIARVSGAWRVSTFTYDGATLRSYAANTNQTRDGVRLNVAFVISNARSTTAVVSIYSPDDFSVSDARLTRAGGAAQQGRTYFAAPHPTGVVVFERSEDAPARLDLTITHGSTKTQFSQPLPRA